MPALHVIILAAGEGTRMRSRTPKVLHTVLGRPLVGHVVSAAVELGAESIVLVVPEHADALRVATADLPVDYAIQNPPRGTGDAARRGLEGLEAGGAIEGHVLVINGDCPGIRVETLRALVAGRDGASGTFLSVDLDDPTGYGRMVRDHDGGLSRIVEEADCDPEQKLLREVNAGIYLFEVTTLRSALDALRPENAQEELYLTDTLEIIRQQGGTVSLFRHDDVAEVHGVNTRAELAEAEDRLRLLKLEELMASGVTIRNPATTSVDVDVTIGADTILYPGVVLESGTVLGERCTVYPNVRVARSQIGDEVTVLDGSVVEDSVVEDGAAVGPYARLRPGAHICAQARVGNFVEVKATRLGRGSKASHLTYLGNAEIGEGVNVGAGTITCNYDGVGKHTTVIEDGAFIGSNTALVAPVRIGAGSYVGAGSTITKDVPPRSLVVARGRQVVKEGWADTHSPKARKDES